MGRELNDILDRHGIKLKDDELAHYGKKGMRWGVRKSDSSSDSTPEKPKGPDVSKMSDDELRTAINRLKMEKEFKKLTQPEVSMGRKIVGELLLDVGKTQAKNLANREVEKLIVKGMAKAAAKGAAKAAVKSALKAA